MNFYFLFLNNCLRLRSKAARFRCVIQWYIWPIVVLKRVKEKIKDVLHSRKVQVNSKKEELDEVNKKIDNLEEKLINDQIDSQTYKKWFKRLRGQKAILEGEIQELNKEHSTSWITAEKLLPSLTNIPEIFEKANIFQKHSILREVFKAGLMFNEGSFRTPFINPALSHNLLILKEKGLLFLEQPSQDLNKITMCSEIGS